MWLCFYVGSLFPSKWKGNITDSEMLTRGRFSWTWRGFVSKFWKDMQSTIEELTICMKLGLISILFKASRVINVNYDEVQPEFWNINVNDGDKIASKCMQQINSAELTYTFAWGNILSCINCTVRIVIFLQILISPTLSGWRVTRKCLQHSSCIGILIDLLPVVRYSHHIWVIWSINDLSQWSTPAYLQTHRLYSYLLTATQYRISP